MDILNFTLRLLKHGSIFLLKLLGFAIGSVSGVAAKNARVGSKEADPWEQYHDAPYHVGPNGARTYYDEY